MKKFLFLTLLLIFTVIFNACYSTSEQMNSANSSSKTATANSTNQATETAPANMIVVHEAEKKSREVFNNGGNTNTQIVAGNPVNDKDNNYKGRPAPDNSTFQSSMNAKGQFLETRTFNNHPQLAKVERYIAEKKILIYLKNGKIVEVAEDKLPTFQSTVPGTILEAAGVKLNAASPEAMKDGTKIEQKKTN